MAKGSASEAMNTTHYRLPSSRGAQIVRFPFILCLIFVVAARKVSLSKRVLIMVNGAD